MDKSSIEEVKNSFYLTDFVIKIKDDKEGRFCYICLYDTDILIGIAEKLQPLGSFVYAKLSITDAIEDGYFKESLEKCKEESISYMDFCWTLVTNERLLKSDIMYKVLPE